MENIKKVFWCGVTPLERGSDRAFSLAMFLGGFNMSFPDETIGMGTYDSRKGILNDHDVIATDQEIIDKSYEDFFCSKNWGKQIVQFKDGEWKELEPGFSKVIKLTKNN